MPGACSMDVPVCDPNGHCENASHDNGDIWLGVKGMAKPSSAHRMAKSGSRTETTAHCM